MCCRTLKAFEQLGCVIMALCQGGNMETAQHRQSHILIRACCSAPINSRLNVVGAVPDPVWVGQNGCWPSRGSLLPRALPYIFSLCYSLNDRRRAAHSIYKIGRLFSLFPLSCPTLALLLLLMSGNVHSNPGPIFPCSVCAGNVTGRGQVSAMLHLLQMGPSKMLTTFPV